MAQSIAKQGIKTTQEFDFQTWSKRKSDTYRKCAKINSEIFARHSTMKNVTIKEGHESNSMMREKKRISPNNTHVDQTQK